MAWRPDEPNNKYFKSSVSITNIDISWLGCVLLACDTRGNLYLYKLLPDGGNLFFDLKIYIKKKIRKVVLEKERLY